VRAYLMVDAYPAWQADVAIPHRPEQKRGFPMGSAVRYPPASWIRHRPETTATS